MSTRVGANQRKRMEMRKARLAEGSGVAFRGLARVTPWIAGVVLLAVAGWFGFQWVSNLGVGAKLTPLRTVLVEGNRMVGEEELVSLLGVESGTPLLEIPVDSLRFRVLQHPGILDAQIHRKWPHALRLQVKEARRVALLHRGLGWAVLTEKGGVIPIAEPVAGLPVAFEDSAAAAFLTRMMDSEPSLFASMSQLAPSADGRSWEVYLQGARHRILFRPDAGAKEFGHYQTLAEGLPAQETEGYQVIDMRFAGFAVARGAGSGT